MQPKLWREPRAKPRAEKPPRERLADRYDRQNREAARIILAKPQRYAGLPLEWARLWRSKRKEKRNEV